MSCKKLERPEQFNHQGLDFAFTDSMKNFQTKGSYDGGSYDGGSYDVESNGSCGYGGTNPHDRKQKTASPPESMISSSGEQMTTYTIETNTPHTSINTSYADLNNAYGKSDEMEIFENKLGNSNLYVTPTQVSNDLDSINAKLEEISKDYTSNVNEQSENKIRTYPKQIPPQSIYPANSFPLQNRPYFRRIGASNLLEPYGSNTFSDTLEYYTGMNLYKWGLLLMLLILLFVVIYCVSSHTDSGKSVEIPFTETVNTHVGKSADPIRKNLITLQHQIKNLMSN